LTRESSDRNNKKAFRGRAEAADIAPDGGMNYVLPTPEGGQLVTSLAQQAAPLLDDRFHEIGGHGTGLLLGDSSFAVG